jgi:hypothetical protein
MKTTSHLIESRLICSRFCLLAIACFMPVVLRASFTSEVIERMANLSGHFIDDAGRAAAREGLEAGLKRYGDEAVQLAEKGGLGLPQAAARHGDEVWRLARLSPEAPRALAARAEPLLQIGRKFGDDAVMLEIKAPGTAELLASRLPSAQLSGLAGRATETELKQMAALAMHASPHQFATATTICQRGGGRALEWLTPARIATGGFATALVIAAWRAPESLPPMIESALQGLLGPTMLVASWLLVLVVLVYLYRPLVWLVRRALEP